MVCICECALGVSTRVGHVHVHWARARVGGVSVWVYHFSVHMQM